MFKIIAIICLAIACVSAKPAPQFLAAYTAPSAYAAAPYTTAVVSNEYHGVSSPFIAASPYSAPLIAASPYTAAAYAPYYF